MTTQEQHIYLLRIDVTGSQVMVILGKTQKVLKCFPSKSDRQVEASKEVTWCGGRANLSLHTGHNGAWEKPPGGKPEV